MKIAYKKIKEGVTKFDLFSNSQLLRYGQEPQYKSANGGLCSIGLLLAFIVIFTSTVISTINMTNITSTTTLFEEVDPSAFQTTTLGFMFAIGITNFNLTDPTTKYFNIEFSQRVSNPKKTIPITLVPCSRQIWTQSYPDIGATFDRLKLKYWLCLPPNTNLSFQGKFTSDVFQYVKLGVRACSQTVGDNRTCVNQTVIDNMIATSGPLSFNYYFINTIINPNDQDYLGSYLQDRNYFTFTMQTGTTANVFISAYNIQSDVSLLPLTNIVQDTGGILYEPTQNFISPVNSGNPYYIQLFIRKSSLSLSITRVFYKFSDCLSYIGGLFSSIMTLLAFMSLYNESAYQIDVTSSIFKQTKKKKIKSKHFNIFTFIASVFYTIIRFFGANPEWQLLKQFDSARQQISKQLNIKLLLKKVVFLQDCMEYLFDDFELNCLHLKDKLSLKQAAKNRKKYNFRPRLLKLTKQKKETKGMIQQTQLNKESYTNTLQTPNQQIIYVRSIVSKQLQTLDWANINIPMTIEKPKETKNNFITDIPPKRRKKKHSEPQKKQQTDSANEEGQFSEEELSSESENGQRLFYDDILNSIHHLQSEAKRGKERCAKIYNGLDQVVKGLAEKPDNQECSLVEKIDKQVSQQFVNPKNMASDFEFDLTNQNL